MSLYLCVAMAVLMTAGLLLVNRGILKLMNTPDTILDDTAGYIGIIYAGLPVTIAYNMLSSVSRSLGDSRTPLIFLIISSVLNIILDIVLITVIPLGVRGSGLCHRHRPGCFRCGLLLLCKEENMRFLRSGRANGDFPGPAREDF